MSAGLAKTILLVAITVGGFADSVSEAAPAVGQPRVSALPAQRNKPPVPDLTSGGQKDDKHDWTLGPTGARGWMWGWKLETIDARQILITKVDAGSPADGVLRVGDVILGIGTRPFDRDPRRTLGEAITAAESKRGRGTLRLLRWRDGARKTVALKLPVLGDYALEAPFGCAKSAKILELACQHIARNMKGDIDGMMNALALLASGDERYLPQVRELAHQVGSPTTKLSLEGRVSGMQAWMWGYRTLFLTEYFLATKDSHVLQAIETYATYIARGQSGVGTWGHGMAWPDLNGGELHGSLGGYGALNQAGLVCHLSLVLARMCGVEDEEIEQAIERANRFAAFYVGKGAIPYGDHRPGWQVHDDNGKNSVAAIIFDLQDRRAEARFFAKMTAASYAERERGHTGNYFSFFWGPLGVSRAGSAAAAAFLKEQRWYYDLARRHDGSFPYQGGAGMSGGEHKYGNWDCTGAFVLASALPLRKLHITGKGSHPGNAIEGAELEDVIAAGRGFDSWKMAQSYYQGKTKEELFELLRSWSPAVRHRAAEALAKRESADVPRLLELLDATSLDARYGACQALGALGQRAAAAVPALTETLARDDVWLRIQAAYALSHIGQPARGAASSMLELALRDHPEDPRGFTQRYLSFCLFYPGGALKMRGLLSRSLEGVDRELLYPAVRRLLQNDDGRARSALATVYDNLTLEEIAPLLPAIVKAVEEPAPSGVMFASGIRLSGLDLLARHRMAEGMALCLRVMDIGKWGKRDRITRCLKTLAKYGGSARPVLPQLRQLEEELTAHWEAKGLTPQIELCKQLIADIEAATDEPSLRSLSDFAKR
jgi:hypothetical protein